MALGLIVCGVGGRMGGAVVRLIPQTPGVKLVAALDREGSPRIGRDAGEIVGTEHLGVPVSARLKPKYKESVVIIDFTHPMASLDFLRIAAKSGTPMVIGTTGFNAKELAEIKRLSRKTKLLLSPNMSVGVNLLLQILGPVAKALGEDYDVEIVEAHHRFKKDAPSGTALALGQTVGKALKREIEKVSVYGRKGIVGERKKREVGFLSIRAGDIVGEHSVIFGGLGERVELSHRAHSRDTFARGALRAAQWLVQQKNGLYSMQDALRFQAL